MSDVLIRTVSILQAEQRSTSDLDFLSSQLMLLNDLRQYIYDLSDAKKLKLFTAFKLEIYEEGEVVFVKGDVSNKLYVILSGKLDMLDVEGSRTVVLIATLSAGKMIGERGLVRRTFRMLTARAHTQCFLLILDQASFRSFLESAVYTRMEEKLKFIDRHIPCARPLLVALKERLAYTLNMQYFHRGRRLLGQGETLDEMYFVFYGECVVWGHGESENRKVVKLSSGCWFGEECVLLGLRSIYDVSVSSEYAWLYSLTRESALKLLPEATIELMKAQYLLKHQTRTHIASQTRLFPARPIELPALHLYKLASPAAKRLIIRNKRKSVVGGDDCGEGGDEASDELRKRLRAKREMGLSLSGGASLYLNTTRSGGSSSRLGITRPF